MIPADQVRADIATLFIRHVKGRFAGRDGPGTALALKRLTQVVIDQIAVSAVIVKHLGDMKMDITALAAAVEQTRDAASTADTVTGATTVSASAGGETVTGTAAAA